MFTANNIIFFNKDITKHTSTIFLWCYQIFPAWSVIIWWKHLFITRGSIRRISRIQTIASSCLRVCAGGPGPSFTSAREKKRNRKIIIHLITFYTTYFLRLVFDSVFSSSFPGPGSDSLLCACFAWCSCLLCCNFSILSKAFMYASIFLSSLLNFLFFLSVK